MNILSWKIFLVNTKVKKVLKMKGNKYITYNIPVLLQKEIATIHVL